MLRSITIEDLYQFKQVSRPRISPDGQRVAFVVTTIDERKQEYHSSIWIASTDGGVRRSALLVVLLMLIVQTGRQMGDGLHLSQIERANLSPKIKQSRKSKEKLNHKSGLFQLMEVRRDNSHLCNMGPLILSGRRIANR